ncbi:hypothetical protein [Mesorhizobium sp. B4-1-4]|uniref:hypothetical protein n=1 Tax=Mesorhizobium sp. B4-1-4 TaxID=2589888 RepID=UPI0015E283DC|nr:hypothetical protein [Mesorhizobium sp. B4-1-4]UCI31884.1 hypothetical protein FJW03_29810 [Mesorhizobium sp. B4-1-4]
MATQALRSLGILNLERGVLPGATPPKPRPGSLLNPATFDFPVIVETVEGAWADRVVRGDPTLESACIVAARRLVERGAVAISSNCGFFIRHQAAVAGSVNVPVALSSLLLIPLLLRQLPPLAKLAVLTIDSTNCSKDLFAVDNPADLERIVIGGIENGTFWKNEMMRPPPPTDLSDIEADVTACIKRLCSAHPEIALILFECTGFPLIAPAIRRAVGLPVYDITTLSGATVASVK